MVDYGTRDVQRLWSLRDGGEFDALLTDKFHWVCKEDFEYQQKIRGVAGAVEVPTTSWCLPWPPRMQANSLPADWSSQALFDLILLEQLARLAIQAPAKAAKEARAERA